MADDYLHYYLEVPLTSACLHAPPPLHCSAIYMDGNMQKSVSPYIWVIFISALGLVIGLATYGYNVTR